MEPQTNEVAATPASTSLGELLECLDIDWGIPHIPQGTFWPGSSHIRLGSGKPQSNKPIASLLNNTEPYSSQMKRLQAVEPVSFCQCNLPARLFTLLKSDLIKEMVNVRALPEKLICKLLCLTSYLSEKQFVCIFCYLSAIFWFLWPNCEPS
jgi:hypothetical protein